jgi:hypothetical protein
MGPRTSSLVATPWFLQALAAVGAGLLALACVVLGGILLSTPPFPFVWLGGWLGAVVATWATHLRQLVRDPGRLEGAVSGRIVASTVLALALSLAGVLALLGGPSTHVLGAAWAGACAAAWAALAAGEALGRRLGAT